MNSIQFSLYSPTADGDRSLHELMDAAFIEYSRALSGDPTRERPPWDLPELLSGKEIWIAQLNGAQIGCVVLSEEKDVTDISFLAVLPAHQGKGIGSWMLEEIERVLSARKVKRLTLHTAAIMEGNLRLYERFGFVETHRKVPEDRLDTIPRVYMDKKLSE